MLLPQVMVDPLRGSTMTNPSCPRAGVVAFYYHRGTAGQWIREGKGMERFRNAFPKLRHAPTFCET